MIHSLFGKIIIKKPGFVILETNGIGFKTLISSKTFRQLPKINSKIRLFCHLNMRQDGLELYGFLKQDELEVFELLNSVNGIGPKIALKIINTLNIKELMAAISKDRHDFLTKVSGIGRKTAQRLILELRDKIKNKQNEEITAIMETDIDIEKALKNLGYKHGEIKDAIKQIPTKTKKLEERLKIALKLLAK
jgi:Holliday junction DNA helicase RuvA